MAKTNTTSNLPPFDPENPATDMAWVQLLDPLNQVGYWTAKRTFDKGRADYDAALQLAKRVLDQALAQAAIDYAAIKNAYIAAAKGLDSAVTAADDTKKDLIAVATGLNPAAAEDPAIAAQQQAALQAAVAAYVQTLQGIATATAARDSALTALQAASDLPMPADPAKAVINPDTTMIAEAQRKVADQTAATAFELVWENFLQARWALYSTLEDQPPACTPQKLEAAAAAPHREVSTT